MALDTQEKRMAAVGVGRPWLRSHFPRATPDEEWRVGIGLAYGGNALSGAVDPPADAPTFTVPIAAGDSITDILDYLLAAELDGTEVRVRLQTRRLLDDGTYIYSENSIVKTIIIETVGPTAPLRGDAWPGKNKPLEGW